MAFDPSTQRLLFLRRIRPGRGQPGPVCGDLDVGWCRVATALPVGAAIRAGPAEHGRGPCVHGSVLHGGSTYDYSTWTGCAVAPIEPELARRAGGLRGASTTPQRREVVVHGGDPFGVSVNQTWIYRTASPASVVSFGSGGAGSFGVPQLMNKQDPTPGSGTR